MNDARMIEALMLAERRGMERAARLVCRRCRDGVPRGSGLAQDMHVGTPLVLSKGPRVSPSWICEAAPIWDVLAVKETDDD